MYSYFFSIKDDTYSQHNMEGVKPHRTPNPKQRTQTTGKHREQDREHKWSSPGGAHELFIQMKWSVLESCICKQHHID